GASRRYDGPFGKSDRAFAFGLLAVLIGIGIAPGLWTTAVLSLMLGLTVVTSWNRARRAVAEGQE
ncbi:MAG: CDP-alcohol phosphatidyltransferase family protein, partial [Pseudomonadota bacterium]